ncbi:MAG: serine acetyltransferase [Verrucomicrobiales bacterium]|nr:serine acetyltransferase [Verrucomicrobiales bacterium]
MFETLRADLRRNLQDYAPRGRLRAVLLGLTLNSVHAILLIRLQFWCARHRLPTIFAAKLLFWLFKIEISREARIGPGLRLPHPMGLIIAPQVVVGANCDLYADVRLVLANGLREGPRIGNHVFLGDGAKVVGRVNVGDHAVVGVSSVVTRDIPPQATAVGIPARIIDEHNERARDAR